MPIIGTPNVPLDDASSVGVLVSLSDLVDRVRTRVDPNPFESYTTADVTNAATAIPIDDPGEWQEGDVVEFQDTGEQAFVRDTSDTGLDPVKRGHNMTVATEHLTGTIILKSPDVAYKEIIRSLNNAVNQLWPYAWDTATVTFTPVSGGSWYAMPTDFVDLVAVSQTSSAGSYIEFGNQRGYYRPVEVAKNLPESLSASGKGIRLAASTGGGDLRVTYRRRVSIVAVQEGLMADIVVAHAIASLLQDIDVQRHTEDVSMGDASRSPGSSLRTSVVLGEDVRLAKMRLKAELLGQNPPMFFKRNN